MVRRTFAEEYRDAQRELLELKTAQLKPAIFRLFSAAQSTGGVTQDKGPKTYTIHYDHTSDDAPLLWISSTYNTVWAKPYDAATGTQKIRMDILDVTETVEFYSTHKITSITYDGQLPDPSYPTVQTWIQVQPFVLANMGTAPGWCLMNCRLAFGDPYGTFNTAREDMLSQQANGTLHDAGGYPPADIQVPVYIDTGIPEGHVVVWDKGTVYSDGSLIPGGLNYYGLNNVWGWGELVDGWRVVQHS